VDQVTHKADQHEDTSRAFLAPADLRQHDLPSQAALGFHRGRTDELLNRAADTIERLSRELAEIRQARENWKRERDRLEGQLEEAKTRAELLVGEAMLDAHKAGQALKAEAEAEADAIRAEAEALLEPARLEAQRLVAEAQERADRLVADAEAEVERLAAQAEQYKLLAADVQQRSVTFMQRALDALGGEDSASEAGEEVTPFRSSDQQAVSERHPEAAPG
jgi:cell division septum initiation protein DivIVA